MDDAEREDTHVYYFRISHIEFPEDSKQGELQALYKEYIENVTHKNPLVLAYYPYTHLYGSDSREFVEVFVVKELADIEKSADKIGELVEAHWPDTAERKAFFKNYSKYYSGWHAAYIYQNVPALMK